MLPEFVDQSYENKWFKYLSENEYHSDTTAVNTSALKVFQRSPQHYYSEFILKEKEPKESNALRFGRVTHLALLQPKKFIETVKELPDFGDLRSTVNRTKKAEWVAAQGHGAEFITREERKTLFKMIESIQKNSYAMKLLENSSFEITGYFRDPETGLKCRIRPDILKNDYTAMPDLKTTTNASASSFSRDCWNYGYYIQLAFYAFGIEQITGKRPELPCFIVIEKEPPYSCVVYAADEMMMSRGHQTVRTLLNRMAECVRRDNWPGYFEDGVGSLSLPAWTEWSVEI